VLNQCISSCGAAILRAGIRVASALLLLIVAYHPDRAAADSCPAEPYPEVARYANNLGTFKVHLLNYKCFGGYERDVARIVARAQAYIIHRSPLAAKPAIVLDIDETALSNWRKIEASDFRFVPQCDCGSFSDGADDPADAIDPILKLFDVAKTEGVAIFFLTARTNNDEQRAATAANLRAVGYDGWTDLIMQSPNSDASSIEDYKAAQRADIEARGFRIIANIGDQFSDLAGGHAERQFKLPNPFYYVP
jgi:hypothetical protein